MAEGPGCTALRVRVGDTWTSMSPRVALVAGLEVVGNCVGIGSTISSISSIAPSAAGGRAPPVLVAAVARDVVGDTEAARAWGFEARAETPGFKVAFAGAEDELVVTGVVEGRISCPAVIKAEWVANGLGVLVASTCAILDLPAGSVVESVFRTADIWEASCARYSVSRLSTTAKAVMTGRTFPRGRSSRIQNTRTIVTPMRPTTIGSRLFTRGTTCKFVVGQQAFVRIEPMIAHEPQGFQ